MLIRILIALLTPLLLPNLSSAQTTDRYLAGNYEIVERLEDFPYEEQAKKSLEALRYRQPNVWSHALDMFEKCTPLMVSWKSPKLTERPRVDIQFEVQSSRPVCIVAFDFHSQFEDFVSEHTKIVDTLHVALRFASAFDSKWVNNSLTPAIQLMAEAILEGQYRSFGEDASHWAWGEGGHPPGFTCSALERELQSPDWIPMKFTLSKDVIVNLPTPQTISKLYDRYAHLKYLSPEASPLTRCFKAHINAQLKVISNDLQQLPEREYRDLLRESLTPYLRSDFEYSYELTKYNWMQHYDYLALSFRPQLNFEINDNKDIKCSGTQVSPRLQVPTNLLLAERRYSYWPDLIRHLNLLTNETPLTNLPSLMVSRSVNLFQVLDFSLSESETPEEFGPVSFVQEIQNKTMTEVNIAVTKFVDSDAEFLSGLIGFITRKQNISAEVPSRLAEMQEVWSQHWKNSAKKIVDSKPTTFGDKKKIKITLESEWGGILKLADELAVLEISIDQRRPGSLRVDSSCSKFDTLEIRLDDPVEPMLP